MMPVLPPGVWVAGFAWFGLFVGFFVLVLAYAALAHRAVGWLAGLGRRCVWRWRSWRLSRDLKRWSAQRRAMARRVR